MHVAVAGWLLGPHCPHSGANRRLQALLAHAGPQLAPGERITVLHARAFAPPPLPGIAWRPIDVPPRPTVRRWWRETRVLARTLRELGATLLDHGFLPLPRTTVPSCLVVHDLRAADGFSAWPRWLARAVLRSACRRAAAVVAPSRWTAERLRALAPNARIEIVPNGVELPACPATSLPFAPPPNGYLLHVGHVEPRKNLAVVVDALRTLPAAARPELWLAGRDAGALASLRARAHDVAVRALGAVDDAQLAALYRGARAVVVPSLYEGFGMPALEGLAHGCAVLASDAGALPEVVGDAGTVLPAHGSAAWAAAIAASSASGDRDARRRHAAAFSWAAAAAQQLALWRRVHAAAH
jgi:glycosyltransferase involved in cell wall biosynthesis